MEDATPEQKPAQALSAPMEAVTLEQKIVQALSAAPTGLMDALQIAKAAVGPNATQKMVNPTLYAMCRAGMLETADSGGTRPMWKLAEGYEETARAQTALENEIIAVVGKGPASGMDALQIAKAVIGPKGRKTDVNPTLYELLRKDKLKLVDGQGAPKWGAV
jgi:hypothetical protein